MDIKSCYTAVNYILIVTVLSSCFFTCLCDHLFTSTDRLRDLSKAENQVIPEMTEVIRLLQERIDLLHSIASDIKNIKQELPDESDVVDNPLQAYQIIKRWYYIYKLLSTQFDEDQYIIERKQSKDDYHDQIQEDANFHDQHEPQDDVTLSEDDDTDNEIIPPVSDDCEDTSASCGYWAARGDCTEYADYMTKHCRQSCKLCRPPTARDKADDMLLDMSYKIRESTGKQLPNLNDFVGSTDGLLRLQETYQLETDDIFHGDIKGFHSVRPLTYEDCYYIGMKASKADMWKYAIEWLEKADKHITDPYLQSDIKDALAYTYIQEENYLKANETLSSLNSRQALDMSSCSCFDLPNKTRQYTEYNICEAYPESEVTSCAYYCQPCKDAIDKHYYPMDSGLMETIWYFKQEMRDLGSIEDGSQADETEDDDEDAVDDETYRRLCRGEGMQQYTKSVCRYRPAGIDWNCYKEEILKMNPRISMVYDVITDSDAEILKSMAKNKMSRGLVGTSGEYSNIRISNVGWLDDLEDEYIRKLSEKIELITGLEVTLQTVYDETQNRTSSDSLQAVNYGIGGHYEPHVDYFQGAKGLKGSEVGELTRISGDRIATFLIYLTDVTAGGATVYPKVKVRVPPVKNSAAFWFNARMSGRYDRLTLHAGCPVLLGEKWVCNKWVREYGNEFKRKCGLTVDAKYS